MLTAARAEDIFPCASDAGWRAFKTVHCNLLARRAEERGAHALGDGFDRALVRALGALALSSRSASFVLAALYDAGCDLGQRVVARRIFEDTLRGAIVVASATLATSGLGRLELKDHFHRSGLVAFGASPALAAAPPEIVGAFVAGALDGTLSEAFNCAAHVTFLDPLTFEVRLGEGRDVNRRAAGQIAGGRDA